MRTIDEIDTECAQAVLELGRRRYHLHLCEREIAELNEKIFGLNAEALAVRQALETARAQLDAERKADDTVLDAAVESPANGDA